MIVVIIDNNELIKEEFNSSYVYKRIVIDKTNVQCSDDYKFLDNTKIKPTTDYKFTVVALDHNIELFIYPDNNSKYLLYENKGLSFGKSEENDIVSHDNFLDKDYFILKDNIIQSNSSFLFINNKKYNGQALKDNDIINVLGFELIYFKNFLYINNFMANNKLKLLDIKEKSIKYEIIKPTYNNYYIDTDNELIFDKLKDINLPHLNKQRNLFVQVGPSLTMSLAMLFVAYINVQRNRANSLYDVLPIVIMPITMLLSALLWPIISHGLDVKNYKKEYKKEKNDYLNYLNKYDKKCDEKINKYLLKEYDSFFYKNNILNKLFYIQKNSKDFETISLGLYTKINNNIYSECEDEDINKYLENINNKINHIKNHPLRLDIKRHKIITVYSKDPKYLLKRYLLELSVKYHYNDLNIAIFDKTKEIYKNIENIPHIFSNTNRLTFSEERDLNKLKNINKELIILTLDKFETTINDNAHIIYFTDKFDLFKDNECVVEYKKDYGVLNDIKSINFNYNFEDIDFDKCFEQLSYYYKPSIKTNTFSFNSFYNVFDIEKNYSSKQTSLVANFSTSNGKLALFDLHENKDGPHGLVGGSTGSGKSELIVSMILSLCIKYRPDYLNIILIDYKGGGICDSLTYNGKKIPHIIGEISNLSQGAIERLIYALSFECKRREEAFKKMSNLLNTSISNIDDYIDGYKECLNMPKIAHLLIIVDEFAELKKNSPEIIKQLISFSRIGRSLGIHLILSTQKPSGVIDDEIWSNSHFKIALKMHDEKDSKDIIKTKDAAYLNNPGDFILRVDNNISKRESLYSKKDYLEYKQINVSLLNDQYEVIANKKVKKESSLSEALYYTSKIIDITDKLNIKTQSIDFEKPNETNRNKINKDGFTLGIVDDYLNAKKYILNIPFNENIFIYSTRDNEINNILNILNENKKESIIISNKYYEGEYICNSILYDEADKINYLFNICDLKDKNIYIVIEDFSSFIAYDDNYIQYIYKLLKKSNSINIFFILLTKQSINNYKILNCFNNKLMINIRDTNELVNIFGRKSRYINNSYFLKEEPISFVPCVIEEYKNSKSLVKPLISDTPDKISISFKDNYICVGYDHIRREYVYINKDDKTLILSLNHNISLLKGLFKEFNNIEIKQYSHSLNLEDYINVLWLGEGIFKQRLFMTDLKSDLHRFEAYLIGQNDRKVFRFIDFE